MTDLPPLRETVEAYGLLAKKALGQHFLLDLNITRKIAALTEAGPGDTVLEVGPGPGGLTRALLETSAHVTAIERDARVMPILAELAGAYPGQLTPVEGDALRVNEADLVPTGTIVASNLPYNISTELLVKWLTATPRWWSRLVLMFQREVGDRIVAAPGSKTYGRLSVMAQAASVPRAGFNLPARAFTPPPKIASSVLVFDPPSEDSALPLATLARVTAAAFGQRRKMIRTTLKPVFGATLPQVLEAYGIPETARAEELSVSTFLALAGDAEQAFRT